MKFSCMLAVAWNAAAFRPISGWKWLESHTQEGRIHDSPVPKQESHQNQARAAHWQSQPIPAPVCIHCAKERGRDSHRFSSTSVITTFPLRGHLFPSALELTQHLRCRNKKPSQYPCYFWMEKPFCFWAYIWLPHCSFPLTPVWFTSQGKVGRGLIWQASPEAAPCYTNEPGRGWKEMVPSQLSA